MSDAKRDCLECGACDCCTARSQAFAEAMAREYDDQPEILAAMAHGVIRRRLHRPQDWREVALARFVLDRFPSADDGEPVTEGWLLSLPGAGRPDETGPRIRVPAPGGRALDLFPWKGGWAVEAREQHPGGDYAGRVSLPDVHTRGHVRRLLAALGVTPGESR